METPRTVEALSFRALYYPVRIMLFFKNLYQTDIIRDWRKKSKENGSKVGEKWIPPIYPSGWK